jgi:ABC-type sugar transport system ATPase subunit
MASSASPVGPQTNPPRAAIEVRSLERWYGGVHALRGVDLEVFPGEILALVGDNGAGKSTLLKILAGGVQPTSGQILVDGVEQHFAKPADATAAGIATVYQDLALAPDLDIVENMFLGREELVRDIPRRWFGHIDRKRMEKDTRAALDRVHIRVPSVTAKVGDLSGGQRQAVAFARAVTWCDRILLLDEPTAALGVEQQREVLDLILKIREETGLSIVLVSHQLPHVLEVADRIAVLRRGAIARIIPAADATSEGLVAAITGLDTEDAA